MPDLTAAEGRHLAFQEMSEDELIKAIIELAHLYGWLLAHFRPARTERGWRTAVQGDAGFADLVLARRGVVLIRECKSAIGKLTGEQAQWLEATGGTVWRPADLESGAIEEALK